MIKRRQLIIPAPVNPSKPAPKRKRLVGSIRSELVTKSREAALSAISIFNSPQVNFKSETFIVLMIIAWTYAFHAYFRGKKIDYRYRRRDKPRLFDRTKHGAIKHWQLETCLEYSPNPLDAKSIINLKLLIGIRHQIEHQMTASIDTYISDKFQSCTMNFNDFLKTHFGESYGLDKHVAFSIQFSDLAPKHFNSLSESSIPQHIKSYIMNFEAGLSQEELDSPQYSYSMIFTKKLTNRAGDSTQVAEFVDPNSELAQTIDKNRWVIKEKEKPKLRPKSVISRINAAGFPSFRIQHHTRLWQSTDSKNPAKNYGVDVEGTWFWYENWVAYCIAHCEATPEIYQ